MSISQPLEKKKLDKVIENSIRFYQGFAVIVFILLPIFAYFWWQTPFIGAYVRHSMVISNSGPAKEGSWALYNDVKGVEYQLIKIEDIDVDSPRQMSNALSAYDFGDEIQITIETREGEKVDKNIKLSPFPAHDKFRSFYFPYLLGLTYLGISLWMSKVRLSDNTSRAFTLFSVSFSLSAAVLFDTYTTSYLTNLWLFSIAFTGGSLWALALSFPREFQLTRKVSFIRSIGYIIAVLLSLLAFFTSYNTQAPYDYIPKWHSIYTFVGATIFFFISILSYRSYTEKSPIAKQQIKTIWFGILFSFMPIGLWLIIYPFYTEWAFNPYFLITTILFPIVLGYAILRYRLLKIDYIISRSILVALLTIIASMAYILLIWGIGLIVGSVIPANNIYAVGGFVALLTIISSPIITKFKTGIDKIRFKGKDTHEKELGIFGEKITKAKNLTDIITAMREALEEPLLPDILHIYTHDSASNQYVATKNEGKPTSDIRFTENNPLVQVLQKESSLYHIDPINLPLPLEGEASRLKLLNASFFIPMKSINRLIGWIGLGTRRSGDPYNSQELEYIEKISNQAGMAIERAQVVVNMEKQVEEMNALTRISQGVSITLSFNDVLELIFAQTTQIIPATDFHITLRNQTGDYFYFAFCIEDHQRLEEKETLPLPYNQGIAQWIARNSRALLAQDYRQECQRLNVVPSLQKVYAWAGVPLNAGSETIGALSIASRDPIQPIHKNNSIYLEQLQTKQQVLLSKLVCFKKQNAAPNNSLH